VTAGEKYAGIINSLDGGCAVKERRAEEAVERREERTEESL